MNTILFSTKERTSSSVSDLSKQMREMQSQIISENEDAELIMQALRGKNINDDDAQVQGLEMNLIDFDDNGTDDNTSLDPSDRLPYEYDPVALKNFFSKRPNLITARIAQVMSKGGSVVINFARDVLTGAIKKDPELEVKRAAELRDTITSLGPFFIKLGQALSIRPDILSPRSMVELQKLCDKVPSFDSQIAFETIERELGKPVNEIFSEITPEPVAAASLGQVYKATLRATGETVAVKVNNMYMCIVNHVKSGTMMKFWSGLAYYVTHNYVYSFANLLLTGSKTKSVRNCITRLVSRKGARTLCS